MVLNICTVALFCYQIVWRVSNWLLLIWTEKMNILMELKLVEKK